MKIVDAMIIGAGPAGVSCALGLAKKGWKVLMIDKSTFPRQKTCGGFVGPENKDLLVEFGLWSKLLDSGACRLQESLLTSSRGASALMPIDGEAIGVSRKLLDKLLLDRVKEMGIEVYEGAQARSVYKQHKCFEVTVDHYGNNKMFNVQASHLIDASGQHAACAKISKVQLGIAAMYEGIPEANQRVMLHCCQGGHVGINPFEGGQVNLCYVVDAKFFKAKGQNAEFVLGHWINENPHLKKVMLDARRVSDWKAVHIPHRNSIILYEKGIWRVGNSAAIIDTITGGGISVALTSGQILALALTGKTSDEERLKVYMQEYKRHFADQRRLAAIFGYFAHYPWAANLIIQFLSINHRMRKTAMSYARPGVVIKSSIDHSRGVLSEV